jgi:integrase
MSGTTALICERDTIALPSHVAGSGTLDRLVETARDYAQAAASENTLKAYAKDWAALCPLVPDARGRAPALRAPADRALHRRSCNAGRQGPCPFGLVHRAAPVRPCLGLCAARRTARPQDRHIATCSAGIRRKHARPPVQKEAILPEDLRDMLATLPHDLRGLRDRAILLIGFAGGLRRSEIVNLDHGKDDTPDSGGWVEILDDGVLITLRGKTGWREVEIARGSATRPARSMP